jgi:hypothetical protein
MHDLINDRMGQSAKRRALGEGEWNQGTGTATADCKQEKNVKF